MELDSIEERKNIFMDNGINRDTLLYFYDFYFFNDVDIFEPEEKEEDVYFDSFTNLSSSLQTFSSFFLDYLTSLCVF